MVISFVRRSVSKEIQCKCNARINPNETLVNGHKQTCWKVVLKSRSEKSCRGSKKTLWPIVNNLFWLTYEKAQMSSPAA